MPEVAHAEWERNSLMTGYGIQFRRLTAEDLVQWPQVKKELDERHMAYEQCIAVVGSDLGPCLAAVVHIADTPIPETGQRASLVWSDHDGTGTPMQHPNLFAYAVQLVLFGVHPHLM